MKLKKSTRIQREIKEETLDFGELKHHEFELPPEEEEVPKKFKHLKTLSEKNNIT